MSNLLINEYPLTVLPSLAVKIGLNEAIVLQQFHYWLNHTDNKIDGKKWIYNTYTEWNKQFPFWGRNTLIRAIKSLEDKELILSGNFNKMALDKTKWYTIDYEAVERLEVSNNKEVKKKPESENQIRKSSDKKIIADENARESSNDGVGSPATQNGLIEEPKMGNSNVQNGYMDNPEWDHGFTQNGYSNNQRLPETTPEITTETSQRLFEEEEERLYYRAIFGNQTLKVIAEYLLACELSFSVVKNIILNLKDKKELWKKDLIEAQIRYMSGMNDIYDYATYFLNGLNKRYEQGSVQGSEWKNGIQEMKNTYDHFEIPIYDFKNGSEFS